MEELELTCAKCGEKKKLCQLVQYSGHYRRKNLTNKQQIGGDLWA